MPHLFVLCYSGSHEPRLACAIVERSCVTKDPHANGAMLFEWPLSRDKRRKQQNKVHLMFMNKILAFTLIAAQSVGATAQPATQERTSSLTNSLMEEIIVTARKREQSLQDVSLSVTALSETLLQDAFITSSEDLTSLVPSLNLQKSSRPGDSSFNIRGIGTQSSGVGIEPSVSTVLDGVVLGRSGMAFLQLLDIERVEVLRGAQGTLFGKNSTAGVIHIITQKPSDSFEASVSATLIEDDEYRTGITLSGPVSDTVGYRLTGSLSRDDGFVENVQTGTLLNGTDDWSLRGKLRWDVSEDLTLEWSSDISKQEGDCCVSTFRSADPFPAQPPNNQTTVDGFLNTQAPVVPSEQNTQVNHDFPTTIELNAQGHSLTADWDLNGYALTSISAYREWGELTYSDVDGQPMHFLNLWQIGDTEQSQFTQEFRIASPLDQAVSYVAGLYYFDQTIDREAELSLLNGTGISTFSVDALNYAAFGEANWSINDRLRLILGARYTKDEIEFEYSRTTTSLLIQATPFFGKSVEESDLSGKLVLEWNAGEDALLYASYVDGYKGPAFNVVSGSTQSNTNPVDSETSNSFELGLKSNWLEGRLIFNVALFHSEYSDFQGTATETTLLLDENGNTQDANNDGIIDTNFSFILTNVGEITTQGIELDFVAQATENLSLFGGLAFIDAQIDSYVGGPCGFGQEFRDLGFRDSAGCGESPAQQDLSGGDMPFSPDWKFNIAANYVIPFEASPVDVVLKANYRIQDDVLLSVDQDPGRIQESYDVLDLSIQILEKTNRYSASIFVKNALDQYYASNISVSNEFIAANAYSQFLPRNFERRFGVEFRMSW